MQQRGGNRNIGGAQRAGGLAQRGHRVGAAEVGVGRRQRRHGR